MEIDKAATNAKAKAKGKVGHLMVPPFGPTRHRPNPAPLTRALPKDSGKLRIIAFGRPEAGAVRKLLSKPPARPVLSNRTTTFGSGNQLVDHATEPTSRNCQYRPIRSLGVTTSQLPNP